MHRGCGHVAAASLVVRAIGHHEHVARQVGTATVEVGCQCLRDRQIERGFAAGLEGRQRHADPFHHGPRERLHRQHLLHIVARHHREGLAGATGTGLGGGAGGREARDILPFLVA